MIIILALRIEKPRMKYIIMQYDVAYNISAHEMKILG